LISEVEDDEGRKPSIFFLYELDLLSIEESWPEEKERQRIWVTFDEATGLCTKEWMTFLLNESSLGKQKLKSEPLTEKCRVI
jgi:hypothetical protein